MPGGDSGHHETTPAKRRRKASSAEQAESSADGPSNHNTRGAKPQASRKPRAVLSCGECNRRKQKCDRKEPCSQCVSRNVSHLCAPLTEAEDDTSLLHRMDSRMAGMETQLAHMFSFISATLPGSSVEAPVTQPPTAGAGPQRAGGWGSNAHRVIRLDSASNPGLQTVLALLQRSGVTSGQLETLLAGIPGRRLADDLVDFYFEHVNWTRYPIHQPYFRRRYDSLFESFAHRPLNPHVDLGVLRWLPMMFSVLLIAVHEASTDILTAEDQTVWEERLYASARTAVDYARAAQMDNVDVMLGALLISRYTLMIRRPAEGGIPLSMSFPLGLYRDGTVLHLSSQRDIEIRRRAWAMLYHLDRSISLLIGRPPIISDAHTDTQPPANLEDDELEISFNPTGHPLSFPTQWTYILVRHRLAEILGRIAYHTFAVKPPVYQTVLDLDRDLLAWQDQLPSFLAMANPDRSEDERHSYLYVQRHLLALEWYYARVTLHRPYLLRRGANESHFVYSQTAAIESATADLLERRSFVMEKGAMTSSGGYRLLDSLMVLEVVIKLEVDTPRAIELQRVIDIVSGRIPDETGQISEPLGQDELSTIEGLTARTEVKRRTAATEHPADASMRDVQAKTLVDFVKTAPESIPFPTMTAPASWQPAASEPVFSQAQDATPDGLASWAAVFEQMSAPTPSAAVGDAPQLNNHSSTSLLDSLMGNVNSQAPFDSSYGDLSSFGEPPEQRFNPFALAQSYTSVGSEDQPAVDEQTMLLDFLLSAIANQQPVGQ